LDIDLTIYFSSNIQGLNLSVLIITSSIIIIIIINLHEYSLYFLITLYDVHVGI